MPVCPVCFQSTYEIISQPDTSTLTPSVAVPTDMSGVLPALAQLIHGYNMLRGAAFKRSPTKKKPRYEEQKAKRLTAKVKVFSKQDPTTFIEFKQINGMTFKDTVTGELWVWQRGQ